MSPNLHFAILAPVPLEHLESSLEVCAREGEVAFGSRKFEVFRKVDELRKGERVPVLIYPSLSGTPPSLFGSKVRWFGWYTRSFETNNGTHPSGMKYRPESTSNQVSDNLGHWATFWHLAGLRQLPADKHLPIGKVPRLRDGIQEAWKDKAIPHGPTLVGFPEQLRNEA